MNICKNIFMQIISFLSPNGMLAFSAINKCYIDYIWLSMMLYYYPNSLIPLSSSQSYIRDQLRTALYYRHVIDNNLRLNLEWRKLERIEICIEFSLNSRNRRMLKDVSNMFIERKNLLKQLPPAYEAVFRFMAKGRKFYANRPKSDMRLYGFSKINDEAFYYLIHYNNVWSKTLYTDYDDYDYDYKFEQGENSWVSYCTKKYPPFKF